MEKREQIYEGKAKKVFATDDPKAVIVSYKDDATAFNGLKKGTIANKGVINNVMTNHVFRMLESHGIETHLISEISKRETLVKKVKIILLEVVVRNIAAGSLAKRLGLEEGSPLLCPVLELCYKRDDLGDPMVNDYHILAAGIATKEEIDTISQQALKINNILIEYFAAINVDLIDFKLEFGRFDGRIILADEISPDTCRFWDKTTKEKLDKDRFRRDLDNIESAYIKIAKRLNLNI